VASTSNSRKAYHHGDLAKALLTAALEAIAENGVAAISLRDIARRAGVSHGAPAHHFKDKAGLLTALATQGFIHLRDALNRARAQHPNDSNEAFNATGVAYVMFAIEHRAHFEIMFQPELLDHDSPALESAGQESFQVLLDSLHAVRADGYMPQEDTESQAIAAWALVHGLAHLWLSSNLPAHSSREQLEQLAWRVVRAFDGARDLHGRTRASTQDG
jgi:AcrR family transcriptional regulator